MKKEDWINSILESSADIKPVDVNPFLYQKTLNCINHLEIASAPNLKFKLGWAIMISTVIAFNINALVIYKSKINRQNESVSIETLSNELMLATQYNY